MKDRSHDDSMAEVCRKTSENHWLKTDYRTLFRLCPDGRIERENDPDCSPGPRFWLAGCSEGNVFGVRADVPDDIALKLEELVSVEPPFTPPAVPKHLERYLSLLGSDGPVTHDLGLIYELPHEQQYPSKARLIGSGSEEGESLMQSWAEDRVPEALFELGFREVADFWTPWCAAVVDGEVASIAFAARLADAGAELGLVTAKAFRGQGFAAAATAGWSRLSALRSRTLFYSTDRDNISSQRVAARLGLRLRGASLRISRA
ncbi:kasugamycin N-acetyltransferase AAC(2')-IIa [Escherichia coli]|uniref:kasugamycin N-acetyltransferase AAC(2')-IIa n=1 Tax=Escherichia coli TaxID=562 RepID=UPI0010E8F486|nr:kasugamycin N-acetyltransferase AAC(2')-IIa [Escherichia coli]EIM7189213.1 kasugamycin N-acetyltransferase AAC(2')-IIa [Escherichia coli]EIM7193431.1 kasugamycin N-acetyltransferase AAC(2')-IIa [Escherichia coli]MBV2260192.1 kasugamycin N-acetyltransferase AAC(2')-IIa [Escherichia coli]MBV2415609.1 kasugamycin N-acetyltransferase AAC(2')-IIa [Escherichia coli]MCX3193324.1 kasugamycin N-acetyltransferase AAC(2')-IIa [Escherichia coli]